MKPKAWYCPKCKKFDLADVKENLASPEHVPHRGFDIGDCEEEMIPLFDFRNRIRITLSEILADGKETIIYSEDLALDFQKIS